MVASRMVLLPEVLREFFVKSLVALSVETRANAEVSCPECLLLLCAEGANLAHTLFKPLASFSHRQSSTERVYFCLFGLHSRDNVVVSVLVALFVILIVGVFSKILLDIF